MRRTARPARNGHGRAAILTLVLAAAWVWSLAPAHAEDAERHLGEPRFREHPNEGFAGGPLPHAQALRERETRSGGMRPEQLGDVERRERVARAHGLQERRYREHEFRDHAFREREFREPRFFDDRYHHDHYYPPPGFVFGALPPGYYALPYRRTHLFFSAGVWYREYAPSRFVVIEPPVGVVVPALPPFYTTVWVDDVPYYYADDVYYVQTPQGYRVAAAPAPDAVTLPQPVPYVEQPAPVPPPPPGTASPPAHDSAQQLVFAYPQHQQSAEQQAKDRQACHRWAAGQTGFDPAQPPPGGGTTTQLNDFRRAITACLETRGYTVK